MSLRMQSIGTGQFGAVSQSLRAVCVPVSISASLELISPDIQNISWKSDDMLPEFVTTQTVREICVAKTVSVGCDYLLRETRRQPECAYKVLHIPGSQLKFRGHSA